MPSLTCIMTFILFICYVSLGPVSHCLFVGVIFYFSISSFSSSKFSNFFFFIIIILRHWKLHNFASICTFVTVIASSYDYSCW